MSAGRDRSGVFAQNFSAFLEDRKPGQPFCFWVGGHEPHRAYERHSGVRLGFQHFGQPECVLQPGVNLVVGLDPSLQRLDLLHHSTRPFLVTPEGGISLLGFQRTQPLFLGSKVKESLAAR